MPRKSVSVRLNPEFYAASTVRQAARDFASVCSVKVNRGTVVLTPKQPVDLRRLADEFCNYVLGLNSQQKVQP